MSSSSEKVSDTRVSVGETESADKAMSDTQEGQSKAGILQDALQGSVGHELTYFERKAALINEYAARRWLM